MDDKDFDKIIRQKAEAYTDTDWDSQALVDMQKRLNEAGDGSFFSRNKSMLAKAAAVAFFAALNILLWAYYGGGSHQSDPKISDEGVFASAYDQKLVALQGQIDLLQVATRDTVYVYLQNKQVPQTDPYATISDELIAYQATQQAGNRLFSNYLRESGSYSDEHNSRHGSLTALSIGKESELDGAVKVFLMQNNMKITEDDGELYILLDNYNGGLARKLSSKPNTLIANNSSQQPGTIVFIESKPKKSVKKENWKTVKLPASIRRALDKQKLGGWDIQYGIVGSAERATMDFGERKRATNFGVVTEIILSPQLRLETGLLSSRFEYKIRNVDDLNDSRVSKFPGQDGSLGELQKIEIDNRAIKIPLNIKYFHYLNGNKKLFVGAGITPQLLLKQEFNYSYDLGLPEQEDTFVGISKRTEHSKFYFGTVNAMIGTEIELNKKLNWQIALNYHRPIGKIGRERADFESFGLSTSLWFKPN